MDAGHGGDDPGKIGVNDALEKEINLEIAKKLKLLFETEGIIVVMTREEDKGLYDESARNHKVQDMQRRCEIIDESGAALVVSIHQNSYTTEGVKGAQVFYYGQSEGGKELAETIQNSLILRLDPANTRSAKANESYYLLKKTTIPAVIVECGFLSNWEEAERLVTEVYQEKAAWAVFMGVMQYLNAAPLH